MDLILSASESGISMQNSSSRAITTSTASRESRSRSSLKLAVGETLEWLTYVNNEIHWNNTRPIKVSHQRCCCGQTFSKFLITSITLSSTTLVSRKGYKTTFQILKNTSMLDIITDIEGIFDIIQVIQGASTSSLCASNRGKEME